MTNFRNPLSLLVTSVSIFRGLCVYVCVHMRAHESDVCVLACVYACAHASAVRACVHMRACVCLCVCACVYVFYSVTSKIIIISKFFTLEPLSISSLKICFFYF